jgi:actin-related protein
MAGLTIPPYELPDGTIIRNSEALCTAAERLFVSVPEAQKRLRIPQSSSSSSSSISHVQNIPMDVDTDSLQDLVHASLSRCDVDARRDLLGNIVVVGGASLIDGIPNRLSHELTEILPANMKVKVATPLPIERQYASWIGGSILSICGSFQQLWITKGEYQEYGSISLAQHRLKN